MWIPGAQPQSSEQALRLGKVHFASSTPCDSDTGGPADSETDLLALGPCTEGSQEQKGFAPFPLSRCWPPIPSPA